MVARSICARADFHRQNLAAPPLNYFALPSRNRPICFWSCSASENTRRRAMLRGTRRLGLHSNPSEPYVENAMVCVQSDEMQEFAFRVCRTFSCNRKTHYDWSKHPRSRLHSHFQLCNLLTSVEQYVLLVVVREAKDVLGVAGCIITTRCTGFEVAGFVRNLMRSNGS